MPRATTFAHYLMGHAPFKRASFFYAYVGMWLHLLIGTVISVIFAASNGLAIFAALAVGSLCVGLVLYGLLTKRYVLLINIGAYVASIARAFSADAAVLTCFIAGLIAILVSSYSLLTAEYGLYKREVYGWAEPLPVSATILLGAAIVLLCILGIRN